jgi:hypothetical protein
LICASHDAHVIANRNLSEAIPRLLPPSLFELPPTLTAADQLRRTRWRTSRLDICLAMTGNAVIRIYTVMQEAAVENPESRFNCGSLRSCHSRHACVTLPYSFNRFGRNNSSNAKRRRIAAALLGYHACTTHKLALQINQLGSAQMILLRPSLLAW